MATIRPNVLLITLDQMRFDALRCAGNQHIDTPYMDELAAAGVRFVNAFSECPACVPARRCLMTGRDMYACDQFNNHPPSTFTDKGPFLAECFGTAGYQTHAVGKMHVSPPRFRVGFDAVQLDEENRRHDSMRQDDYQAWLADQGLLAQSVAHAMPCNGYHARPDSLPESHGHDAWVAQEACRFLERRDPTVPFFLYASFRNPHPPLIPPRYYWDLYADRNIPEPKHGNWVDDRSPAFLERLRAMHRMDAVYSLEDRRRAIRAYYALVTSIDHQIGLILAQLQEYWQTGKTIVLLTADHGEMLFDHQSLAKGQFYRAGAGVPFIVVPPSDLDLGIGRGEIREQPVLLQDVMPTVLDMAGLPIPESCDGISQLPVLRDANARVREYAFGAYYHDVTLGIGAALDNATYCIHDEQWKYIYNVEGGIEHLFRVADRHDEYDLAQDPAQTQRLHQYRERLRDQLRRHGDGNLIANGLRVTPVQEPKPKRGINLKGTHGIAWPSIPMYDFATTDSYRALISDGDPSKPYLM
ncbi:MAG: sulfatase-like hydrolase/transferase [Planctomycetota bacterium]